MKVGVLIPEAETHENNFFPPLFEWSLVFCWENGPALHRQDFLNLPRPAKILLFKIRAMLPSKAPNERYLFPWLGLANEWGLLKCGRDTQIQFMLPIPLALPSKLAQMNGAFCREERNGQESQ